MDHLPGLSFLSGINDKVYDILKSAILRKVLPPGCKLDVSSLATKWGVSRSPVNDAMQRLMTEGLVEVVARKGTFVANLNAQDILELMDVRKMFELQAAELTVDKVSQEQLEEWAQLLLQSDSLFAKPDFDYLIYVSFDIDFHTMPILWSQNQQLLKIYQFQNFHWNTSRVYYSNILPKPHQRQQEHWEIYRAYEARSLKRVQEVIVQHIDAGKEDIHEAVRRGELR